MADGRGLRWADCFVFSAATIGDRSSPTKRGPTERARGATRWRAHDPWVRADTTRCLRSLRAPVSCEGLRTTSHQRRATCVKRGGGVVLDAAAGLPRTAAPGPVCRSGGWWRHTAPCKGSSTRRLDPGPLIAAVVLADVSERTRRSPRPRHLWRRGVGWHVVTSDSVGGPRQARARADLPGSDRWADSLQRREFGCR